MRLALVIASLRGGGAERVMATLAGEFAARGHEVTLITEAGAEHDHYLLAPNVRRIALGVEWETATLARKLVANTRRLHRLRQAIIASNAQSVVAFGETTNLRALLACAGTGIPVIVSERTDPRQWRIPRAWNFLRRWLYPRAAGVVVQTRSVAEWAKSFAFPDRVYVIPNPVRPTCRTEGAIRPHKANRVVMGIGRLTREKGFALLVEAFYRSGLVTDGWQLVILGEGSERSSLESKVRALGLECCVRFPGLVASPEEWLRQADIFVLSSLVEGFPNALLEAMACGVACISFACPSGPAEIIVHERTGLLLPTGDVAALTTALRDLAADQLRRGRLGSAARADVAARFSLEGVVMQWQLVLECVTMKRGMSS